jgi:hypothetical protein
VCTTKGNRILGNNCNTPLTHPRSSWQRHTFLCCHCMHASGNTWLCNVNTAAPWPLHPLCVWMDTRCHILLTSETYFHYTPYTTAYRLRKRELYSRKMDMPFVPMRSRIVYTTSNGTTADKLKKIRKESGTDPHTDLQGTNVTTQGR